MEINQTITIHLIFDKKLSPMGMASIFEKTEKICEQYTGNPPEYIALSKTTDDPYDYRATKNWKFNTRSRNKFIALNGQGIIKNFSLYTIMPNWKFMSRDFTFFMKYGEKYLGKKKDNYSISCLFNIDKTTTGLTMHNINGAKKELMDIIKKENACLIHGYILPMEHTKSPLFYIEGGGDCGDASTRTEKENKSAHHFGHYDYQIDHRIWEVFWSNIITRKHIENTPILEEIEAIIGKENITTLADDLFQFSLPIDILNFNTAEYEQLRTKVKNVFYKYDRVIKEEP